MFWKDGNEINMSAKGRSVSLTYEKDSSRKGGFSFLLIAV